MNKSHYLFLGICAIAGCSGGFSNGTAEPNNILPPNAPQAVASGTMNTPGPGASGARLASSTAGATPPPGDVGAYPFSQAAQGLQCPQVQGFTCFLQFNTGKTNTASKAKTGHSHHFASPTPSPTPSPSASPSPDASASPQVSASPLTLTSTSSPAPSGPAITLQLVALPSDAPSMSTSSVESTASNAAHATASPAAVPQTTALLEIRMHTDADVQLTGSAVAQFSLPQEQLTKGRGFAIQLFHEAIESRTSHIDKFMGSYTKSSLSGTTLRFAFTPPPVTIKKDDLWLIVLYGDGSVTPAPAKTTGVTPPSPT